MKTLSPYQFISELLDLIIESKTKLVFISPYVDFNYCERIKVEILNAIRRGVKIDFYIRLDNENFKSWEQIEELGLKPKLVKNLNTKLYFNEKLGIATPVNLLSSFNSNLIEFGVIYNTEQELAELEKFVQKHLDSSIIYNKPYKEDIYLAKEKFTEILSSFLKDKFNIRYVNPRWQNGAIEFNVKSFYYLNVNKDCNTVCVSGIATKSELQKFNKLHKIFRFKEVYINESLNRVYAKSDFMVSNIDLNSISITEKKKLIEFIGKFIEDLTEYKNQCRKFLISNV